MASISASSWSSSSCSSKEEMDRIEFCWKLFFLVSIFKSGAALSCILIAYKLLVITSGSTLWLSTEIDWSFSWSLSSIYGMKSIWHSLFEVVNFGSTCSSSSCNGFYSILGAKLLLGSEGLSDAKRLHYLNTGAL